MSIPFHQIEINREIVPQSELNIENKVRSNLFAWNGQFSPQFIEVLLNYFANDTDIVFDPFLGSGTTLYESARKGLSAFGMELNASAYYMAKTYELVNLSYEDRRLLIQEVDGLFATITTSDDIVYVITNAIKNTQNQAKVNVLCTVVVLLDIYNHEVTLDHLMKKWKALKTIIMEIPYSADKIIKAAMGDSRKVSAQDNSATLLITSPPYINVFNYHQKYRRSVEALGFDVLKIAKNEFGSNRKNRGNRFLTVIQYCIDMALSLKEARRLCIDDARLIYVVGRESSVLGFSFCNSELIYEIATEIFGFEFLLRQERVFKNRFGQLIYEDILHFENKKYCKEILTDDIITEKARAIAVRMLTQKAEHGIDNKNIDLLHEAIKNAAKVKKSEG